MNATRLGRVLKIDSLEALDQRITPSGGNPITPAAAIPPAYAPNGSAMDKLGRQLNIIFQEYAVYQTSGANGTFNSSQSAQILFAGLKATSVGVNIRVSGDFNQGVAQLKALGMQVAASNATTRTITGYLPISQLSAVAQKTNVIGVSPIYKPTLGSSGGMIRG